VWEPQRRVGWAEQYGPVRLAVDFHLEPAEGGTKLTLVHSGFGTGAEWDEQFHMTEGGWRYFLQNLRYYLERHAGTPRVLVSVREKTKLSRDVAWAMLLGEHGLAASGTLRGLGEGDRYHVTTSAGDVLEGTVLVVQEPYQIAISVDDLNDALLFLEIEPAGEYEVRPGMWLSTYGLGEVELAGLRERFGSLYREALAES
jgi:hypothetical protein